MSDAVDFNESYDADDLEIGAIAYTKDADEIEAERSRRDPTPGDHEFTVVGFSKVKPIVRTAYYEGTQYQYATNQVGVRLSDETGATAIDYFDLPPNDPGHQTLYLFGAKNADGSNPGFMAEKFGHFVARLGWPFPKGSPLPEPARKLANWKGRKIIATVEHQQQLDPATKQPKLSPTTGEPYPPKAQIKLFSYRPAGSPIQATLPIQTAAVPGSPARPAAPASRPLPTSPAAVTTPPQSVERLRGML